MRGEESTNHHTPRKERANDILLIPLQYKDKNTFKRNVEGREETLGASIEHPSM